MYYANQNRFLSSLNSKMRDIESSLDLFRESLTSISNYFLDCGFSNFEEISELKQNIECNLIFNQDLTSIIANRKK